MTNPDSTSPNSVAKNNEARVASPPPAYAPNPRSSNIAALIAQGMSGYRAQPFCVQPQAEDITLDSGEEMMPDEESSKSPISLRINSSINVNRNNNIICLESTPSENANAIAQAVAKAILDGSTGRCGIPMIDENGIPRPLLIEVDAGMVVEGANNIIGSRESVNEVLKHHGTTLSLRRAREEDADDENDKAEPSKRRRVSDE